MTLAKSRPGELAYGSAGIASPHDIYAEFLMKMTGIEMKHVPYRGGLDISVE